MNLIYRKASIEDVIELKRLTDLMLEKTNLGLATVDKIKLIVSSNKCFVYCCFDDDKLVGYIAGILHNSIFNDVLRVSDIGVFIDPKYRGTSLGLTLIKKLEEWAKENNAKQIWMGQTTGFKIDKVKQMYESLGYNITGFNALKEL